MVQSIPLYKYHSFAWRFDSNNNNNKLHEHLYSIYSVKRLVRNVLTFIQENRTFESTFHEENQIQRHKTNFTRENRKTKCQQPASSTSPLLPPLKKILWFSTIGYPINLVESKRFTSLIPTRNFYTGEYFSLLKYALLQ